MWGTLKLMEKISLTSQYLPIYLKIKGCVAEYVSAAVADFFWTCKVRHVHLLIFIFMALPSSAWWGLHIRCEELMLQSWIVMSELWASPDSFVAAAFPGLTYPLYCAAVPLLQAWPVCELVLALVVQLVPEPTHPPPTQGQTDREIHSLRLPVGWTMITAC